jgi:hypothetical protein
MPAQQSFEYAIIRLVPQVEREEFLNVGVILYCRDLKFLQMKYRVDKNRITSLFPSADINDITDHLKAFESIAHADKNGGPIAELDMPSRFRWLTAKRSTILQISAVHPGLTDDAGATLEKLFEKLVEVNARN